MIATAVTLAAIGKGVAEFFVFGIEKDAYFFNLSWASFNLLFLLLALLVAWEKPQRRAEERIAKRVAIKLKAEGFSLWARTHDISLSGVSCLLDTREPIPQLATIVVHDAHPITCRARLVYHEPAPGRSSRAAFAWLDLDTDRRNKMILNLFTDPKTWEQAHTTDTRSNLAMAWHLVLGLVRTVYPARRLRRMSVRRRDWRVIAARIGGHRRRVLLTDSSARGLGVIYLGGPGSFSASWRLIGEPYEEMRFSEVYRKRLAPYVWRIGLNAEPRLIACGLHEERSVVQAGR